MHIYTETGEVQDDPIYTSMINFLEVDELDNEDRDGFGSTGTK